MHVTEDKAAVKVNILVVDDIKANIFTMETVLSEVGEVYSAESGNEALSLMLRYHFALAILDIHMPGMNGFELAQLMQGNEKTDHIPIIFVTAMEQAQHDICEGYQFGAADFLLKPFNLDILVRKVMVFAQLDQQKQLLKEKNQQLHSYQLHLQELVEERTEELRKTTVSRDYVDNILRSMIDTLIVVNAKGLVQTVNQASLSLIGYEHDQIIGLPIDKIIDNIHFEELACQQQMSGIEQIYVTKEGKPIPMLFSCSVMRDSAGVLQGIVCVAQDLSERKKAEAQQTSLREKEILLREIHHRVKNNMTVVSSLLELQSAYLHSEDDVVLFKESQYRIHAMALIHEKLYQSKSIAEVDMRSYIEDLVGSLLSCYSGIGSQISVKQEIADISLGIDTASPCGLILNELLTNSLKYAFVGRSAGVIEIHCHWLEDGRLLLAVRDDGIGLPADFDISQSKSLGLQLVVDLIELQLAGEYTLRRHPGCEWVLKFKEIYYKPRLGPVNK